MSIERVCGEPALLAGYVYGDCEPGERELLEQHLAVCPACIAEVEVLRQTREHLASWAPPDTRLGFRVVAADAALPEPVPLRRADGGTSPGRRKGWAAVPAWAQAAAAVLLFACGAAAAALMNIEVRHDTDGVTYRTGWREAAATPAAAAVDPAALDARIRQIVDEARAVDAPRQVAAAAAEPPAATQAVAAQDELLWRVQQMVSASEARQQEALAFRLSQVVRDIDLQRRADIARIEQTVSPMAGLTAEEVQQQRQLLNYLVTVSQRGR
ncbi:MAG: zf-HC2 domain-containing protein [Acidimicrobiia bacterium]|nr:zf-HC2 domain-containing protein [Acidimicrobiia bacterium]